MRLSLPPALRSALAPLIVAAVAIAQLAPGLSSGLAAPISWDHAAHLGKAMLTARELLPSLRGWSDSIEAGVPLNTLYSLGGTAYLLFFRALSPFLEWTQSYALAIVSFRILLGLGIYRLARSTGINPLGACFAGLSALADHGDHSEGGWFYDLQYGVWPMSLAMVFLVFGLAEIVGKSRPTELGLVRAALFFGAALITHQMAMLGLLVLAPLYLVSRWLDGELDRDSLAFPLAIAIGGLLATFWMLPMLIGSSEMSRHGQAYLSFFELGRGAVLGSMILRAGPFTAVLAAIAVLVAPLTRGARRFLGIAALVFIALSARDWVESWGLLRIAPGLGALMYPRFLMLAKPLVFVLIGALAGDVVERLLPSIRESLSSLRGRLGLVLAGLLFVPFMPGAIDGLRQAVITRELDTTANSLDWAEFRAYAAWERSHQEEPFYRVAYSLQTSHLAQAAPAFTGRPSHKIGMLIAEVFGNTTRSASLDALAAMNVRRVVYTGALPPELRGASHEVARFGRLVVADLDEWSGAIVEGDGAGVPRVLGASRERVVVDPRGSRSLLLRRAYSKRWRASVDGVPVRIEPAPVTRGAPLTLQRVEVQDGARRVEFEYVSSTWLDRFFGAVSMLAFVLLLVPKARRRIAAALERAFDRVLNAVAKNRPRLMRVSIFCLFFLLFAVGIAIVRLATRFDARSANARVFIERDGISTPCNLRRADGRAGVACEGGEWQFVGPVVQTVAGELRECVWSHPPEAGAALVIEYEDVPLDEGLRFTAGIGDDAQLPDSSTVEFRVAIGSEQLETLEVHPKQWSTHQLIEPREGRADLRIEVRAASPARRFACFMLTK